MIEKKKSTVTIRPGSQEWQDFMKALEGYSTKAEAIEAFRDRCESEIAERLRRSTKNKNTRKQWVKFDRSGKLWVMPERFKLDCEDRPDGEGFWRICKLENGRWVTPGLPRTLTGKRIVANLAGISEDPEADFRDNLETFREASERCVIEYLGESGKIVRVEGTSGEVGKYLEASKANVTEDFELKHGAGTADRIKNHGQCVTLPFSWTDDATRAANYLESLAEGLSGVFGDEVPRGVWEAVERAFRAGRFAERALSYKENRMLEEGFELADQKGGRAKGATGKLKPWQKRAVALWTGNPSLSPFEIDQILTVEGFIKPGGKEWIFEGGPKAGVKDSVKTVKDFKVRMKKEGVI